MPELPPPPPPPMSIGEAFADLVRRRRPPWLTPRPLAFAGAGLALVLAALVALGWGPARQTPPEIVLPRAAGSARHAGAEHGEPGGVGAPAADAVVSVHAAGGFARPGLYELPAGARVAALLEAAGGPAADAAVDSLNLAAKLNDGERVYLPRAGEQLAPAPAGEAGGAAGAGGGVVDLNAATLADLDALPGVGPSTAQAILDYRKERGRFASVDELLEVRGIGEAKLEALRSRVRV
ncbi:MAG TPA: helix-hairpin-helix domain-containing protein [Acidimicrobiales bacterium]|nr:helix-hairpin-helix domain-containing protein [Acidimicrobiales bacterium]